MKPTLKLLALLSPLLCLVGCGSDHDSLPDTQSKREIVYTIDSKVNRTTLSNDSEWDALLDRFCDYSQDGLTVSFYNSHPSQPRATAKSSTANKEAATISTADRNELKEWMKTMEKAGKTVTVTYNEQSGTWNGTAYANAPSAQEQSGKKHYSGTLTIVAIPDDDTSQPGDMGIWALQVTQDSLLLIEDGGFIPSFATLVINGQAREEGDTVALNGVIEEATMPNGNHCLVLHISTVDKDDIVGCRWHYYSMTALSFYSEGSMLAADMSTYTPESVGNTIYYEFRNDGTMTCTRIGSNGSAQVMTGSWSLSADGDLCCEYFDGDACWTIGCITNGIMVLYRTDTSSSGNTYYQMELHASSL